MSTMFAKEAIYISVLKVRNMMSQEQKKKKKKKKMLAMYSNQWIPISLQFLWST